MLLGLAVLLWIGGFDIIYACQDFEFDRTYGLFSIPACFGKERALQLSTTLHVMMVVALIGVTLLTNLGVLYLIGVGIVTILLIYEHAIVSPTNLSRVNLAFFTLNGIVSLVLMALSVADMLIGID